MKFLEVVVNGLVSIVKSLIEHPVTVVVILAALGVLYNYVSINMVNDWVVLIIEKAKIVLSVS